MERKGKGEGTLQERRVRGRVRERGKRNKCDGEVKRLRKGLWPKEKSAEGRETGSPVNG